MSALTPQRFIELGRLYGDAVGHVRTWAAEGTSAVDAPPGLLAAKELVYEVPLLVAEIERLTADRDKFKQEAKENDGYLSAANATVRKRDETIAALRAELTEAKRQRDIAERELFDANRKLGNLRGVRIWTNEDDKKFAFADDLAVALEWTAPSQAVVSEAVADAADKAVLEAANRLADLTNHWPHIDDDTEEQGYNDWNTALEALQEAVKERNEVIAGRWTQEEIDGAKARAKAQAEELRPLIDGLTESTADGPEQTDEPKAHAYSSHGWPCCDDAPAEQPRLVAKCGGPGLCTLCKVWANQVHLGFPMVRNGDDGPASSVSAQAEAQ